MILAVNVIFKLRNTNLLTVDIYIERDIETIGIDL